MKRLACIALALAACGKSATKHAAKDAGGAAPSVPAGPAPTWSWKVEDFDVQAIAAMDDGRVIVGGAQTSHLPIAGRKMPPTMVVEVLVVVLDDRGVPAAAYPLPDATEDTSLIAVVTHAEHVYVAAHNGTTTEGPATIYDLDPEKGVQAQFEVPVEAGLVPQVIDWQLTALPDGDLLLVGAGDANGDSTVVTRLGPDGTVRWPSHGTGHDYVTGVHARGDQILVSARDDDKDQTKAWTGIGVLGKDGKVTRRCTYAELFRPSPQGIVVDGDTIVALGNGAFRPGPKLEQVYAMPCDGPGRHGDVLGNGVRGGRFAGGGLVGHTIVAVYEIYPLAADPTSRGGGYLVREPQSSAPHVTPIHEFQIRDNKRLQVLGEARSISLALVRPDGGVIVEGPCGDDIDCVERYDLGL